MKLPDLSIRRPFTLSAALLAAAALAAPVSLLASPEINVSASISVNVKEGAKLLATELRVGPNDLEHASCDTLAGALERSITAHRDHALSILDAALLAKIRESKSAGVQHLPCACASKLLRAALTADPRQASALTEQAVVLCPDCADALGQVVENMSDKNPVADGKDAPASAASRPGGAPRDGMTDSFGNPALDSATVGQPGDAATAANGTANNPNAPDGGYAFGAGFGPGFPGSPGFVGSGPSGGVALPSPISNPVTPVTNE